MKVDGAKSRVVPSAMPLKARVIGSSTRPQMAGARHFLPQNSTEYEPKRKAEFMRVHLRHLLDTFAQRVGALRDIISSCMGSSAYYFLVFAGMHPL